jgi:LytR cell envelope-related transcriptional attenuator
MGSTSPTASPGEGSPSPHERNRRHALRRVIGPSLAAVLAVWLMVTVLGLLNRPGDDESAALSTASGWVTGERDLGTRSADPSTSRLAPPVPTRSDAPGAHDGSRGASTAPLVPALPKGADAAAVEAVPRPLPVYVLNQTTRRGLADVVAEDIESAGWSIAKVSWWRGIVPSTTVYYPPGYESAAQALSASFPAIDRVRPAVDPMPDDALTVILCKEYPET